MLLDLPIEVFRVILDFLNVKERVRLEQTARAVKDVSHIVPITRFNVLDMVPLNSVVLDNRYKLPEAALRRFLQRCHLDLRCISFGHKSTWFVSNATLTNDTVRLLWSFTYPKLCSVHFEKLWVHYWGAGPLFDLLPSGLEEVRMDHCKFKDLVVISALSRSSIQRLYISNPNPYQSLGCELAPLLRALAGLSNSLRTLHLNDEAAPATSETLQLIGAFGQLEELSLVRPFSNTTFEAMDPIFRACPRLRRLRIARSHFFDDRCLNSLAEHCPNLESLDISACPKPTASGLTLKLRPRLQIRHSLGESLKEKVQD